MNAASLFERYAGPGHSLTVRRRLQLGLPARLEIGSGALARSLPVVDGVEQLRP